MSLRAVATTIAILALPGCASMNEQECVIGDWHTIGFEDGARGYTADRISQHRKSCAGHGVVPDLTAYRQGRDEGLAQFCRPQNGFRLGSRGGAYDGTCPAESHTDFMTAYNDGRRLYDLDRRVNHADSQIAARQREIDELDGRITAHEDAIVSGDINHFERARLLLEAKDMIDERKDLEQEIDRLEHERIVYQRELEDYRETVAYAPR
ncbi:MAG: DUF2799 domain-containing protein [Gammaproteobacteria bacterium]|jgi:hypothetical protein|nr:MAG: DUF2799 domain-containing protein [Gammaproteobacteria bacterium]